MSSYKILGPQQRMDSHVYSEDCQAGSRKDAAAFEYIVMEDRLLCAEQISG